MILYKRIHIYPNPLNINDAALFLVYSLLISNNIRRDTITEVRIGKTWIIAYGDKIRHLRPDADTSEGWIRAVLRSKRLGASLETGPLDYPANTNIMVVHKPNIKPEINIDENLVSPVIICYVADPSECPLSGSWVEVKVPKWGVWRSSTIINIMIDRIWNSLPTTPC